MKTIIIPDIHNRTYWIEDFLSSIEYDKVIFLGDYFDDFRDTSDDIELAAEWLKKSVHKPNRVHLFGTHDLWYRFPYNPFILVSGNSPTKERIINSILGEKDWKKLRLYYFEQNFLITHAGLHSYLISEFVLRNKSLSNYIKNKSLVLDSSQEIIEKIVDPATKEALQYVEEGDSHPWLAAGISRAGMQAVGGIIWLDWIEEFEPVPGLNQIVGHTELNRPDQNITENIETCNQLHKQLSLTDNMQLITSINYNLDTRSKYIGILEDEEFTWIKNPYI